MTVVQNFAPIAPNETDRVAFDFTEEIGASGAISGVAWTCTVAAESLVADAAAATRVLSVDAFTDYVTSALIGTMVDGVIYQLEVIVNIDDGRVLSQVAGIACLVEIGGVAASKLRIYRDALRHLADARLDLITDDVESRYALDDAWTEAVEFVLRLAAWRFALKTAALVASTGPLPGFSNAYAKPAGWLRTHALFVLSGARECPIDIREQGLKFSANLATGINIRFVSSEFADPGLAPGPWPEHFAQLVAAYLAFLVAERVTGERSAPGRMSDLFSSLLEAAIAIDAVPADPWLAYQLDGTFDLAAHAVITDGFWTKHLKTVQIDMSEQSVDPAMVGLPYRFAKPADWLRTHALFVPRDGLEAPLNIRESAEEWSTDTPLFAARYLSTSALDATTWPEPVLKAVLAYLERGAEPAPTAQDKAAPAPRGSTYEKLQLDALQLYAQPASRWLRYQLDGSFQPAVWQVLEKARWRFAIRTVELAANTDPTAISDGTVSTGYAYRYLKPNDHLRTIWAHYDVSRGPYGFRRDIDFRDEQDAIHADYSPIKLRYLTRAGLDATRWTANFSDAVLALLEYLEMRADPRMATAAAAKLAFFERQCSLAENLDDTSEVPRINSSSRFVAARYGWRGHGGAGGGFDGVTPSSTTILTDDSSDVLTPG